jgi:phosphoribosyl-ATP pyrophosphohydrolase
MNDILAEVYAVIESRKHTPVDGSYTNYLFEKGLDKILKKLGEECAETIIAAKNGSHAELAAETADLLYHLLVMLSFTETDPAFVIDEMKKRRAAVDRRARA